MIEVYHMADPNQDQLMIQRMAYFRLKFIKMTEAYRRFLLDALEPNKGTMILNRCGLKLRGEALGGLSGEEFIRGSTSINEFVESQKPSSTKLCETVLKRKRRTDWNVPPPSSEEEIPEAEWGYAEALADDIVAFANAHGFRIEYIDYDHPGDEVLGRHFASSSPSSSASRGTEKNMEKHSPLLLGIDENKFQKDFGFTVHYHNGLAEAVGEDGQYVMPPSLTLAEIERFMMQNAENYGVFCRVPKN
ncbi:hypothetical protein V498_02810 [Pseudogymnoascus sp. VKM F-4517 (FW-2822)]|nr:hypothetical protein V498_02810 [Pseudogymnoascus sp. VKM F-4517 (FW-2822)]